MNDVKIIGRSIMWLQVSWRTPLPKVTCTKPLNKFPTLCGTQKFMPWSMVHTWTRLIQFTHHYHIIVRLILVVPSYLTLKSSKGSLSLGFPTKNLNTFLFSTMHPTYLTQLILLDFIILIKPGNKYSYELQNGYTCNVFIMLNDVESL